jgi:hypothetical protein
VRRACQRIGDEAGRIGKGHRRRLKPDKSARQSFRVGRERDRREKSLSLLGAACIRFKLYRHPAGYRAGQFT